MSFTVQRKDGFYSLRKHARAVCKYVFLFQPVILRLYPNNPTLLAALAAANAACQALVDEIDNASTPGV